jgi:serine/threonine-protein kinase/endoribonuclease IRE1
LDGLTGKVLRIISSDETPNNDDHNNPSTTFLQDHKNVVWIGRVDHSVSIHDARTGTTDVEFSVAQVMSVADMAGPPPHKKTKNTGTSSSSPPHLLPTLESSSSSTPDFGGVAHSKPSLLIATPSGHIAYRNPETGDIQWVAQETFRTPVVFGIESSTGLPLGVDILQDAPVANSSLDYLARDLERQLALIISEETTHHPQEDQTIVGALSSGQLFAMPLGRRSSSTTTSSTSFPPQQHAIASTSTSAKHMSPNVPHIGRQHSTHFHAASDSKHHHGSHYHASQNNQESTKQQHPIAAKKPCSPSTPNFPGCLVGHHRQTTSSHRSGDSFAKHGDTLLSESVPPFEEDTSVVKHNHLHNYHHDANHNFIHYHPDFGYIQPTAAHHHFQHELHRKSKFQQILRIMGSWLAPTIALIFVLSFELGRRKRLKDLKQNENVDVAEFNNSVALAPPSSNTTSPHVIDASDQVLGYGGQGTVVYKGMLDGRNVAVKRMLKAYHASADREISLLIESDGHPNVVRYFLKEVRGDFVYLALELCNMSLHDLIGTLRNHVGEPQVASLVAPSSKMVLHQIASGVSHLHSLRIVHRDLKPANILLAISNQRKNSTNKNNHPSDPENETYDHFLHGHYVAKISDMGLGKQLVGQSSFGMSTLGDSSLRGHSKGGGSTSVGVGPGSVGWQAPEVMSLRWASDSSVRSSDGSNGGPDAFVEASPIDLAPNPRTSRSVDIFSLGCIFYSTLVPGGHPFGEWYEREANIMHNRPSIDALAKMSPDASDLVSAMISRSPKMRPTAKQVCDHPFFWATHKRLMFLCDFSDRLESDATVGTVPNHTASTVFVDNPLAIERSAADVAGTAWDKQLDEALISNVQRFRTYDPSSVRDLLRLIRNKHHHFDELPSDFRISIGSNQDGLLEYFEARFPRLMMHCFNICRQLLAADDPFAAKYSIVPVVRPSSKKAECLALPAHPKTPLSISPYSDKSEDEKTDEEEVTNDYTTTGVLSLSSFGEAASQAEKESLCEEYETRPKSVETVENGMDPPELQDASDASVPLEASPEGIIIWEGSSAAKTFNCRGWIRSDDEWTRRADASLRKRDPNLVRCVDDPKFRTRLCNHWDESLGVFCSMRKKNKCIFAHGPAELRVKEAKKNRWGKLVDKQGNNSNPRHSGGEDTYGAARSIESVRKEEGKWNTNKKPAQPRTKKQATPAKKNRANQ